MKRAIFNFFAATLLLTATLMTGKAHADDNRYNSEDLLTPGLAGSNGGFRSLSAQIPYSDDLSFQFGFHGQYFTIDNFLSNGDNTSRFIGMFTGSIIPCRFTEFFLSWEAMSSTDSNNASSIQQFGNFNVGAKVGVDLTKIFSVAAQFQAEHLVKAADLNLTTKAWNYFPSLLLSLDLTRLENRLPLRLHLNGGYRIDNSIDLAEGTALTAEQAFYLGISPDNQIPYALGVEVPADFVNFLVEYSGEQIIGNADYFENPQRLTVGAKLFPTAARSLSIDLAADTSLQQIDAANAVVAEPDYNFIFGLSFNVLPGEARTAPKAEVATAGAIAGIVLDDTTLKPLGGAIITFPEIVLTRLQSHPENGTFGFGGISAGTFTAHAELDGYEPVDIPVTVTAGGTATPEFRLRKREVTKKGTLYIKLTDADNRPLAGQLTFADHPTMQPLAIPAKGLLAKLPAEIFRITVSAEGYQSEEHIVTIDPDGKLVTEYRLREKNDKVQLVQDKIVIADKIHFQSGKWVIQPDSYGLLNRVADLISDNAQITRLRIEGHTDSVGKESYNIFISQKRAESVLQYLVSRGVAKSRLEALGYGPSRPLQGNDSPDGRAANRRVEFTVISTTQSAPGSGAVAPVSKPTSAPTSAPTAVVPVAPKPVPTEPAAPAAEPTATTPTAPAN